MEPKVSFPSGEAKVHLPIRTINALEQDPSALALAKLANGDTASAINPVASTISAREAMASQVFLATQGLKQEGENQQIRIGTPADLGIPIKKWFGIPHITTLYEPSLKQLRSLVDSNSIPLSEKITSEDLAKGTLRTLPFQKWWDAWVMYDPRDLQLAVNPKNEIIGFFSSPIPVNRAVANKILNSKKLALDIKPDLKEVLQDLKTRVYLNRDLLVDEEYRGLGLAGKMKMASEEFLIKQARQKDPEAKVILITTHESDNKASARAQDKLGYARLGEHISPLFQNIRLAIRAKILNSNEDR